MEHVKLKDEGAVSGVGGLQRSEKAKYVVKNHQYQKKPEARIHITLNVAAARSERVDFVKMKVNQALVAINEAQDIYLAGLSIYRVFTKEKLEQWFGQCASLLKQDYDNKTHLTESMADITTNGAVQEDTDVPNKEWLQGTHVFSAISQNARKREDRKPKRKGKYRSYYRPHHSPSPRPNENDSPSEIVHQRDTITNNINNSVIQKLKETAKNQSRSRNSSMCSSAMTESSDNEDLVDYLINTKAYDGKAMKSFRSLYGYNYVQNGWMGDIWSIEYDGVTFIKAKISPSQPGVGRKDYSAWIAVSEENTVETGYCTCPAGNARSCSHISAIIYAITLAWANGVGGETCTDKQQAWGKGAAQVLSHDMISDMVFKRPSPFHLQPSTEQPSGKISTDCPSRTEQFLNHSDLQDFVSNSTVTNIWECKGTLLYKTLHAPEVTQEIEEDVIHQEHSVDSSSPVQLPLSCNKCQTFYEKYVKIETDKIHNLQINTINQNTNVWSDSRKLRITSSKVSDLPKTQRADPNKFVTNQIYPRFKGCIATRHGQKCEPIARAWFESVVGLTVVKSGIVVSSEEPYIAASPDGVVDARTIIEIKCPTRPLGDLLASGKYDVVIEDCEPKLSPKGKNGYYCQVQVAMFCTKAVVCKFVVWTAERQCVVSVPYSESYMTGILPRIRDFYFKHLLVRLTDEFQASRLKISSDYKSLCR